MKANQSMNKFCIDGRTRTSDFTKLNNTFRNDLLVYAYRKNEMNEKSPN